MTSLYMHEKTGQSFEDSKTNATRSVEAMAVSAKVL